MFIFKEKTMEFFNVRVFIDKEPYCEKSYEPYCWKQYKEVIFRKQS